ncbi:hypothetical protein EIL50_02200 [bacterium NHP-B]|nr:hypothetical protein EIL50_02200 [bacterium NHP-B]
MRMRVRNILGATALSLLAFSHGGLADSDSFTGLKVGLDLGMGYAGVNPDTKDAVRGMYLGQQVGLSAEYGMDISGFYAGLCLGYDFAMFPKKDVAFQYKSAMRGDLHLGAALSNSVMPTLFIGYGSNSVEYTPPTTGDKKKESHAGLRYGARINFKIMPEMFAGLSTAWMDAKKNKNKSAYMLTMLSVGYHL